MLDVGAWSFPPALALLCGPYAAPYRHMMRIGIISLVGGLLAVIAAQPNVRAEAKTDALDFKEVYDSIREHLAGTTDADLNRAAVKGLLTNLAPKVSLVESSGTTNSGSHGPLLSKTSLYDGSIAYLRIGRVDRHRLVDSRHGAADGVAETRLHLQPLTRGR